MSDEQAISDAGHSGKYFHQMLNMYDDDLAPFEYRLMGHYKRVCGEGGECYERVRTTADRTQMSVGQVVKSRDLLNEMGLIVAIKQGRGKPVRVRIVDRWAQNINRYDGSPGEQSRNGSSPHEQRVHPVNKPVHQVKEGITNQEEPQQEEPNQAGGDNIFTLYEFAFGMLPDTGLLVDELKDMTGEFPIEWIREAFRETALKNASVPVKYARAIMERWRKEGKALALKDAAQNGDRYLTGKYAAYINNVPGED